MKTETIEVKFNNGELENQYNRASRIKARKFKNTIHRIMTILLITALVYALAIYNSPDEANASYEQILSDMNLNSCRITQNEDSHIKKGGWSMYAYDIACIRWVSFEVKAPTYRNVYLIEKVWYDQRLWNYVILKNSDLRFVYAHIQNTRDVWTLIYPWQTFWYTTLSWMSTNHHVHIETWAYRSNISLEYLYWEKPVFNEKSFDLRMQRNIVSAKEINEIILDFIDDFEWLSLTAYDDWRQYSIGYGTPSYKWEVISLQQAKDRARIRIQAIREKYNLFDYDLNIQKAVVSFVYNLWSLTNAQLRLLENWFYTALWNDFKQYVKANWVKLGGLVKRRNAEANLL